MGEGGRRDIHHKAGFVLMSKQRFKWYIEWYEKGDGAR
jgi:hypothetical protein